MTINSKNVAAGLAALLVLTILPACQKADGPAESAGKEIDKAVENAGERIEKAGEKIQDTAKGDNK